LPEVAWIAFAVLFLTSCRTAAAQNEPSASQYTQQQSTLLPTPNPWQRSGAAGEITEDQLKQLLVGKSLYLREGYLDDSLSFNQRGVLISHSSKGSYTLSGIQINKVRMAKRKVVLEGTRYGLHFLGEMPYEDPAKAVDRVRITPRKKVVRITIERQAVVKTKKVKGKGAPQTAAFLKGETATTSPAHSAAALREALDRIFAQGLDARMMADMPDCWKLYYEAAAAKSDYRPADPAVLRQASVDVKARLLTKFEPPSNQFAQDNGVAGMSLYHVVVGADGKPGEIAVGRPIGFGLDENAVEAIRKASFEPAKKDGKPVPVFLNLVVQFRLFSKRTAVAAAQPTTDQGTAAPTLPGPYSVQETH
jgi:TonB family protein